MPPFTVDNATGMVVSGDGEVAAWSAAELVGDVPQVYARERATGAIEAISVGPTGGLGDAGSLAPSLSADGRYVAFESAAQNLLPGEANGERHVYVRDRATDLTRLVSRNALREVGDQPSVSPHLSGDGRNVAFTSWATNLGESNGVLADVYVRAASQPTIASITPSTLAPGTETPVTIVGADIREPVRLGPAFDTSVRFRDVQVVTVPGSPSTVRIDAVAVVDADAPPGPRTLLVIHPGTGPGPFGMAVGLCACLTVGP